MHKGGIFVNKCPICERYYTQRPAISRVDNRTLICPVCGAVEAMESTGISGELSDKILAVINQSYELRE